MHHQCSRLKRDPETIGEDIGAAVARDCKISVNLNGDIEKLKPPLNRGYQKTELFAKVRNSKPAAAGRNNFEELLMVFKPIQAAIAASLFLAAVQASAVTLTFDDLAEGATLSNQYAALGAVFSPNAFSGSGGPTGDWATNTDMTIVSSTGSDVGGLGTPSLVSGNILHSFSGWLDENGDASFTISFGTAVSSVWMDFAGVSTPADVRLFAYNGATLLGSVAGSVLTGQFTLGYSAASITSVAVTPGTYNDWVGVDNVVFAPVPEPATYAMMGLGVAALLTFRRRVRS